jgi:hypothetical protein
MLCADEMKLNEAHFIDRAVSVCRRQQISSRNEALKNVRDDIRHNKRKTQSAAMTKPNKEFLKKLAYCTEYRFCV